MDKKLSLLNSNIEDLYKKYLEKKRIRRNHEKNEQSLVNHINFLIDEERKIRTQIENKSLKSSKIKKKSIRILIIMKIKKKKNLLKMKQKKHQKYKKMEKNQRKEKHQLQNLYIRIRKLKNIMLILVQLISPKNKMIYFY